MTNVCILCGDEIEDFQDRRLHYSEEVHKECHKEFYRQGNKASQIIRSIRCTVTGEPQSQGSVRLLKRKDGSVFLTSTNPKLKKWRLEVAGRIKEEMSAAGMEGPFQGNVSVRAEFFLARPKNTNRDFPYVRPDLDKLVRASLDAMTLSGVITDDSQVCTIAASKNYAYNTPYTYLSVTGLYVPPPRE